jgi:NAD(P)-dependent dehydrogenase (short-subunit alcohol dehydrogenase family)
MIAYEVSKAAMNRMTVSVAGSNAKHGVRCNAILPGFMDTQLAIAAVSEARNVDPAKLREQRNAMVPLGGKMGDGWDTAYAALFLASDEAKFITGVLLPVDGGMSTRVG